jgi:hypothetical protein
MRPSRSSETRSGRFLPVIALAGLAFLAPRPASGDACVWTGTTSTNWDTATNWNTCGSSFPDTTADSATISTGTPHDNPVIATGDSFTVSTLAINGGTLTVDGSLAIQGNSGGAGNLVVSSGGTLNWRSGTMSGSGTTTISAGGNLTLNLSPGSLQRALVNQGTATASGTSYINISVGGSINNSGTWEIQNDQGIFGSSQILTNSGTIKRTTSSGLATVQATLNGSGAVQVESGKLALTGGGTFSGASTFTGNILSFNGGTWALTGSFSGGSGGTLLLDSGTLNFNAGTTFPSLSLLNGAGSTANFNTGATIAPANITISSGTLAGSDAVQPGAGGTFTWTGGAMSGTGTTTIGSGRTLLLSGSIVTLQRPLVNQGAATMSGNSYLSIGSGGSLNNSGTWEIQNDQGIYGTGQITTNSGTIKRTTSAGAATIQTSLNGSGAVQVQSGTLLLTGGGTNSGSFTFTGNTLRFNGGTWALTGNFSGASGGTLLLDSGTLAFNAGATLTSVSLLNIAGSTTTFNTGTTITPANLTLSSGTLTGPDAVQPGASGTLTWTGGTMSGTGTTTIGSDRTLLLNGGGVTLQRPLVNQGTATASSNAYVSIGSGGSLNNSGAWEIQNDQGIYGFSQNVANSGTISRTTSSGTATLQTNVSNTGAINVETGTLALTGTLTQTAGGLHLLGGNLTASSALNIQGGVLDGNGTINGNVSVTGSGQFSPGTSPGEISILNNRNYTQAAPGVFAVDINGTTAGVDYDRLLIAGAANLGGELKVTLGYAPAVNDAFTILQHASRTGAFTKLTFPSPGAGLGWDLSYSPTATKLTIAQLLAATLAADKHAGTGTSSDTNGVLEPGERVVVEPGWQNMTETPIAATGTGSALTGPGGATYALNDTTADYGSENPNTTTNCFDATANCYQVSVSDPTSRPSVHWDASFHEAITGGAERTWKLHLGDSFTDVPRNQPFYARIEALLHNNITAGCTATTYCPTDTVNRGAMAIFIAKALAGGGPNIPVTGDVSGSAYNCAAGGNSLFADVAPTDIYCKHVHYIAGQNVTAGCSATTFCPLGTITRIEMAAFIAKAIVAPQGGTAIPKSYTDPVSGLSYNCSGANIHFTDVPASNVFCKHVHYLWAKGIVSGISPTLYGPTLNVSRDAMAKFLALGFNLLLYGPVP